MNTDAPAGIFTGIFVATLERPLVIAARFQSLSGEVSVGMRQHPFGCRPCRPMIKRGQPDFVPAGAEKTP